MIPMIGQLYRENNVKAYMYGKPLINRSVIDIMKHHRAVRQVEENELSEYETFPVLKAMGELNLGSCHIDLGKLAVKFMEQPEGTEAKAFVAEELSQFVGAADKILDKPSSSRIIHFSYSEQ